MLQTFVHRGRKDKVQYLPQLHGSERLCHQKSVVVFISRPTIKFHRGVIAMIHFKMQSVGSHFAGLFLDETDRFGAVTAASKLGLNIQLVDERVVAAKLKAETQR